MKRNKKLKRRDFRRKILSLVWLCHLVSLATCHSQLATARTYVLTHVACPLCFVLPPCLLGPYTWLVSWYNVLIRLAMKNMLIHPRVHRTLSSCFLFFFKIKSITAVLDVKSTNLFFCSACSKRRPLPLRRAGYENKEVRVRVSVQVDQPFFLYCNSSLWLRRRGQRGDGCRTTAEGFFVTKTEKADQNNEFFKNVTSFFHITIHLDSPAVFICCYICDHFVQGPNQSAQEEPCHAQMHKVYMIIKVEDWTYVNLVFVELA